MDTIQSRYFSLCNRPSDIFEHLPTLYRYASDCETVIECGVRRCVSTWALVYGLLHNNKERKEIIVNDIVECDISDLLYATRELPITVRPVWISNLKLEVEHDVDMVFIDTWHVYGQLKRELNKFGKITKKYMVLHDTTVDEIYGESIRKNHDVESKMEESGFPAEEITTGLWKAVEEFLSENRDWRIKERYTNNNGLTVLEKIAESC